MVFSLENKKDDWKEYLTDEAKQALSDIFDATKKHRGAYSNADDVKIAQLWAALIEMKNELDSMKKQLGALEEPWKSIVEIGNLEKKKAVERLVKELVKPIDEDSKAATKKLVDSLMKF